MSDIICLTCLFYAPNDTVHCPWWSNEEMPTGAPDDNECGNYGALDAQQQRIRELEARVAEADEFEAGALPVVNTAAERGAQWEQMQQRIAALEALCRSALPTVKHAYLTKHCPSEHEWLKRYIDLLGAGRQEVAHVPD